MGRGSAPTPGRGRGSENKQEWVENWVWGLLPPPNLPSLSPVVPLQVPLPALLNPL